MKNSPTPEDDTRTQLPDPWREALNLFDKDLRRRGAAERTRRAYGVDLGQLAGWCAQREIDPAQVHYKTLRRYAAHLSERRVAPATVARKLAAATGVALLHHDDLDDLHPMRQVPGRGRAAAPPA